MTSGFLVVYVGIYRCNDKEASGKTPESTAGAWIRRRRIECIASKEEHVIATTKEGFGPTRIHTTHSSVDNLGRDVRGSSNFALCCPTSASARGGSSSTEQRRSRDTAGTSDVCSKRKKQQTNKEETTLEAKELGAPCHQH
jgi:hypothetical protein